MTTITTAALCEAYARLRCTARLLARLDYPEESATFRDTAVFLVDEAPIDALPDLDTVKRIIEIDTVITDPLEVLLRASIHPPEEATSAPPAGG